MTLKLRNDEINFAQHSADTKAQHYYSVSRKKRDQNVFGISDKTLAILMKFDTWFPE